MTRLSLIDLTKEYEPGVTAVSNLTFNVEEGELMVLLGPSGCGKSTTLRLVAGLLRPTAGDLHFDGQSILATPPEKRGAVMVFQEHALFPFMSVGENVAFGLKMQKLDRVTIGKRVAEALTAVQLPNTEDRWPDQLSGGQRQRVALARALVIRPNLLLLDEPFSSLDRPLREELREMVRTLQKNAGITTLFVTHDQAEAVAIADRIGLMVNGRLRQIGQPRDFYENPADAEVARFFGGRNFISGTKQGQIVQTAIGPVETKPSPMADGPVLLTIRPEAVEFGANCHNNFAARVQNYQYQGANTHCHIDINGTRLDVLAPSHATLREGEEMTIHLPRKRLCILPIDGGQ